MAEYAKPLPEPDADTQPFWDYCRRHELRVQRCRGCGHLRFPPGILCPRCHALAAEWVRLSGKGTVFSYSVNYFPYHPEFAPDIPYNVAVIQLEEGPRLISSVTECPLEALRIDMPVEVWFEDVTPEFSLPRFRPVS